MRIPRVHVDAVLAAGAELALPDHAASHVTRVLRLAAGERLRVFDGRGHEHEATLVQADRRGARCAVGEALPTVPESDRPLELVQGVSRGERMDYTLQKAVELGVTAIRPVMARRSTVRLDAERAEARLRHWHGVIVAACEQCGRARLPVLAPLDDFAAGAAAAGAGLRLVLRADAPGALAAQPAPAGGVTLLIGPEGGLAPEELDLAGALGYRPVRLGPRILRTETAALAALAAIQALWGDFR